MMSIEYDKAINKNQLEINATQDYLNKLSIPFSETESEAH
jgi:hypothetical protein